MSSHPNDLSDGLTLLKRVVGHSLLWTVVCGSAAIPSFVAARGHGYDEAGMIAGILAFVALYVVVSTSASFRRRWSSDPQFQITFCVSYVLRVLAGVVYPVGFILDLIPGMMSTGFVNSLGLSDRGFLSTFVTTIAQGLLLNLFLAGFMLVFYALQGRGGQRRQEARGFAVIPAEPLSANQKPA